MSKSIIKHDSLPGVRRNTPIWTPAEITTAAWFDAAKAGYDIVVAIAGATDSAVVDNVKVERITRIGS